MKNTDYLFSFEKLNVWQEARKFISEIYELTKSFPTDEKFGLTNQIRRASVSIAANIAEGTSRTSSKDQAHFTNLSYSSLMEALNHLYISLDLNYITDDLLF
ncbi:MAG: four helix bundle protein, partial [Bacteroidales bacterium]|nr:four helix bundle protein [Bacteroidales bacterium]